ncbi:MAG: SEC-C metal-binding domain-containing protein, partial [Frisingicoccus sp.]
ALTEEQEFRDIYGMDVIEIPTNEPVRRIDHEDLVYKTKREKVNAVTDTIVEAHEKGQPVLVGTITIESSEIFSDALKKRGIPHKVLNAKFHELEAEIVAQAGQRGAVTIATNMAGRGTDIKLGEGVAELGGLMIIGTERHESRRIDNQLRGRSGRQGDPGESRFYISLEDDLMRLFGSERLMGVFNSLGFPEGEAIQHKMLSSAVEKAQMKIESNNYGIRKNVLEYDQVMNEQREIIYAERLRVLDGDNMRDVIFKMIRDVVKNHVHMHIPAESQVEEKDLEKLEQKIAVSDLDMASLAQGLVRVIPYTNVSWKPEAHEGENAEQFIKELQDKAIEIYEAKEKEFPEEEHIRELERVVLLKMIDRRWMDHIDNMEQLRQSIGLQAYGQRDPLVEYRFAGYDMFDEMTDGISEDTVQALMHIRIQQTVEREEVAKVTGTNKDESAAKQPVRRKEGKVYPNDPCPCGSGKKYKQCCGRKK